MSEERGQYVVGTRIEPIQREDGRWTYALYAPDGDKSADAIGTRSYESEAQAQDAALAVLERKRFADILTEADNARVELGRRASVAENEAGRLRAALRHAARRNVAAAVAAFFAGAAVAAAITYAMVAPLQGGIG